MEDPEAITRVKVTRRQPVDRLSHQKQPFFHFWFKFLLLLCLVLFILCYTMSSSSSSWWERFALHEHYQRFINRTYKVNLPPPYKVHPKHRAKPNEIQETTLNEMYKTTTSEMYKTTTSEMYKTTTSEMYKTTTNEMYKTTTNEIHKTTTNEIHKTTTNGILSSVTPTGTQYHQAYARNYHFIMDNTEVCKTKNPFLALMVPVAPHNIAARDAIRQTWANNTLVQGKVVITLFMLGLSRGADVEQQQDKLKQENLKHHDLIQSDFMDTYLNLTIKTMVIMEWLATRCPNAAYAMKIDSDMFLNIDNLVIMLQKPGILKTNYLTGMLMWNRPVVRSKNSKWYVPEEMYPDPMYPTYTLGMGYVFSNDLPGKFVEVSKSIKPFNIEDAYIGMCMKKLGLSVTSPPDPSQFRAYNQGYNRCEYSKVITYILGSSDQLINYWTDLKKPGPPC